ncbi:50S ribosomal protein L10 [Candidatus Pacearchaeota archaeon]|nr:50S ribosomal protein L10 [Candidatus Pacearchaeota archaeon]
MTKTKEHKIPDKKIKTVDELVKLMQDNKTVLVTSIKNIPASQFQEISKSLRGKAVVKVPKKSLIQRAIDNSKISGIGKLKEKIDENFAILFSNLDSFELAAELIKTKTPAKAKPGQEAPEDIEVQPGPTDLVPGPAISELGALGIQIQIEKGKITIKEPKIIAKSGEKISQEAADIMSKLDIKPFSIGFIPLASFDSENNKIYTEIKINREDAIANLKEAYSKALAFAVSREYTCKETISLLLAKAASYERRLNKIISGEADEPEPVSKEEKETAEEKTSEDKQSKETKTKEETQQDATAGLAGLFG